MMANNYNCLDLNNIKQELIELASITQAKDFILNEEVIFNPLKIKHNNILTSEAMNLIKNNINVQFAGIEDVSSILDKADRNICLSSVELKDCLVFHNHCERIFNIFNKIEEELYLKDYADTLTIHKSVYDEVNQCIDNSGEIKQDATTILKNIIERINSLNKSIYTKAEQFANKNASSLQETSVYTRDNRVCFLVKNSDKNKFGGYAYGSSSSGLACYVEPSIFVDLNNEMIKLIADKDDEIERILTHLSYIVSSCSDDYRKNFDSLVQLNVIFAKANYGIKYNAIIPNFVEGNYFDFKDLCHPLLDQRKVVSNSYRIYKPNRGIVISGTNTGGKTVSLKAIGLSIVMSYLGIPIIASEASIPFYKNIYIDIDDNQSIVDSLSTFSAHISNINNILNSADENSLVLIDELISGTDPKQAQAISLAILDEIKKIGSIFIITTHFDEIKDYSLKDEEIILSSVGFDSVNLKPTYKYYENCIGTSNALEIASRYMDNQDIIERAKFYLKKNQSEQDELLDELSKKLEEVNNQKTIIEEKEKDLNKKLEDLNNKINSFDKEKIELRDKYIKELNDYIDDIKYKAQEKLESIKEKKDNALIKEIENLDINYKKEDIVFNVGDNVRINDNEQIGVITSIKDNKASVDIRGITVKVDANNLTLMPKIKKKEVYHERPIGKTVSKEINLVGQRVEDGLIMMEEYLDKANGARLSSVKVIHGIGSGQLRQALRNRLKKLSYVKSFKDGDFYDGGSAVTIVEFK